jgi:hypothetical protein
MVNNEKNDGKGGEEGGCCQIKPTAKAFTTTNKVKFRSNCLMQSSFSGSLNLWSAIGFQEDSK